MSILSLCSPALLYLIISIFAIIMMIINKMQPLTIVLKTLFIVIWTWVLNLLCNIGHTGISWVLVLVPFVLSLFMFSLAYETVLINNLRKDLLKK